MTLDDLNEQHFRQLEAKTSTEYAAQTHEVVRQYLQNIQALRNGTRKHVMRRLVDGLPASEPAA